MRIFTIISFLSLCTFSEDIIGKGFGGTTIDIKGSYGYVPYAHIKIKNRTYDFYYTGKVFDISATMASNLYSQYGLYYQQMKLKNAKNESLNYEEIDVLNLGILANFSLPIPIRPFIEGGFGLILAQIEKSGSSPQEQQYTSGYGGKASIGFAPKFGAMSLFAKFEGQYYLYKGGEDKYNDSVKLFNLTQDSYSFNIGIILSI